MKLTRSEALFLYSILFTFDAKSSLYGDALDQSEDMMDRLKEFLTSQNDSVSEVQSSLTTETSSSQFSEDLDEDEEAQEDVPEHDEHVSVDVLLELPQVKLTGRETSLVFEVNTEDEIDAVFGDDEDVVQNVRCVRRLDHKTIELYFDGDWNTYKARRLTKEWIDTLEENVAYLVCNDEDCVG